MSVEIFMEIQRPCHSLQLLAAACQMEYGLSDHYYRLEPGRDGSEGILYDSRVIARGIEACAGDRWLRFRLPLPDVPGEIRRFYEMVKQAADYFKAESVFRNDRPFNLDNPEPWIELDLETSQDAMEEVVRRSELPYIILTGVYYPLCLGVREKQELQDLKDFEVWLQRKQPGDFYYSAPMVFSRKDGTEFGVYSFFSSARTILPQDPGFILLETFDCDAWYILLDAQNAVDYHFFMDHCQKTYFDAAHVEVRIDLQEFFRKFPYALIKEPLI